MRLCLLLILQMLKLGIALHFFVCCDVYRRGHGRIFVLCTLDIESSKLQQV